MSKPVSSSSPSSKSGRNSKKKNKKKQQNSSTPTAASSAPMHSHGLPVSTLNILSRALAYADDDTLTMCRMAGAFRRYDAQKVLAASAPVRRSLAYKNGSWYRGVWPQDRRGWLQCGFSMAIVRGKLRDFDGDVRPCGQARIDFADSSFIEGEWDSATGLTLNGRTEWPNGSWYDGELERNSLGQFVRHGWGTFRHLPPENEKERYLVYYCGEWRDGRRHGFGTNVQFDGTTTRGSFRDNKLNGRCWAELFFPGKWDGSRYGPSRFKTIELDYVNDSPKPTRRQLISYSYPFEERSIQERRNGQMISQTPFVLYSASSRRVAGEFRELIGEVLTSKQLYLVCAKSLWQMYRKDPLAM